MSTFHRLQINEKPSTKAQKLVPLLRRASLNIGGLQRQKSFDLTEEEEAVCQESDVSKRDGCRRDLARESIREIAGEIAGETTSEAVGETVIETKKTVIETRKNTGERAEHADSERKDSDNSEPNNRESRRKHIGNNRKTRKSNEFVASGRQTRGATSNEKSLLVESLNQSNPMNESSDRRMDEQTSSRPSDQTNCECFK